MVIRRLVLAEHERGLTLIRFQLLICFLFVSVAFSFPLSLWGEMEVLNKEKFIYNVATSYYFENPN